MVIIPSLISSSSLSLFLCVVLPFLLLYSWSQESVNFGANALRSATTVLSMEPILFNICLCMTLLKWNVKGSPAFRSFRRAAKFASKLFTVSHGADHAILQTLQSFVDGTYVKPTLTPAAPEPEPTPAVE